MKRLDNVCVKALRYFDADDVNVTVLIPQNLIKDSRVKRAIAKSTANGMITTKPKNMTVLEYCECDMQQLIPKGGLNNVAIKMFFGQMITSVTMLHETLNLAHLDLKPENFLVDSEKNVKLADFGTAKHFIDEEISTLRSGQYVAPEINSNKKSINKQSADVFSLGVILFCMYFGEMPFDKISFATWAQDSNEFFKWHKATRGFFNGEKQLSTQDKNFITLMKSVMAEEPTQRPASPALILEHPFFT